MRGQKFFLLDVIKTENRLIYPVAHLNVLKISDLFLNVDYEIVALKIKENDKIYFKNINLSEESFSDLKKRLTS